MDYRCGVDEEEEEEEVVIAILSSIYCSNSTVSVV